MSILEKLSLSGRSILVTGATGHLGAAMTWALAEAGGHVLVNSRSRERSEQLAEAIKDKGYLAGAAPFDIRSSQQVSDFFATFSGKPLHCLINNAYAGGAGSIETADADDYRQSFEMSVVAIHSLFRAALPALRLAVKMNGDASVINLASMYGMVSPDLRVYDERTVSNPPFYGAAKASVLQWTRYAACEFGGEGIRSNAISPGPFPSPSVQASAPEFVERLSRKVPMGRIGDAAEIQGVALLLASPAASFINGANFVVDGGWTSW